MISKSKNNKSSEYVVMSKHHLFDENLSLKAKGLLSMMLALPYGYKYESYMLEIDCAEDFIEIDKVVKELKEFGYLREGRKNDSLPCCMVFERPSQRGNIDND